MWNPFSASTPDETEATPEDSNTSSTLAAARTAAVPLRAVTRSESRSEKRPSAQERLRTIARSRSPSPSPNRILNSSSTAFPFESTMTNNLDADAIERITANAVRLALQQDREERDRLSRLSTEAAVSAALANQSNQVRALRKPELPAFDKNNINIWIRRVNGAYTRAGITAAKDKFAFLESKFNVDPDPKINEFLEKDTDADWDAFLEYLREIHGRTKEQEVNSLLNGTPRDDRRPTALASLIKERAGSITLNDVMKEVLLKEMPSSVKQHAASKIKDLDFEDTAKVLDDYFDQKGRIRHKNESATVNSVSNSNNRQQPRQQSRPLSSALKNGDLSNQSPSRYSTHSSEASSFTSAFDGSGDDAADVNAVRFRSDGRRQQFNAQNRSQSRGRPRNDNNNANGNSSNHNDSNSRPRNNNGRSQSRYNNNSNNNNNNNRDSSSKPKNGMCFYHELHGDRARNCEQPCLLWAQHQAKGRASH